MANEPAVIEVVNTGPTVSVDVVNTTAITVDVQQLDDNNANVDIVSQNSTPTIDLASNAYDVAVVVVGVQGPPGVGGGGGSSFAPTPDEIDDTTATDVFYFGWSNLNGGWLVRRMQTSTADKLNADATNNPAYTILADAWSDRTNLNYA